MHQRRINWEGDVFILWQTSIGCLSIQTKIMPCKNANSRYKALCMPVSINGGKFATRLRDTIMFGSRYCRQISSEWRWHLERSNWKTVKVKLVCNDSLAKLPLAAVKLTWKHFGYDQPVDTIVAVAKGLTMPILLGNLARRRGPKIPSSAPNFSPIGATIRV